MVLTDSRGLALRGYDAVAYQSDKKAMQGSSAHSLVWQGRIWRFATSQNKVLFSRTPRRYVPSYGGYGAWAMAQGYMAEGNPKVFQVIGQRVFLFISEEQRKRWRENINGFVRLADHQWMMHSPQPSTTTGTTLWHDGWR